MKERIDVAILGAGLAGLSLARQLLLTTGKSVLMLEKRKAVPPLRQKVGEATVQISGYYLSKVLDLEEHLLKDHLLKYNLRFYWKTSGTNDSYEQYSQSYIRNLSNIATYQLDRNVLEAELLRLNSNYSNFNFYSGISNLSVNLADDVHHLSFRGGDGQQEIEAEWVIDASGRSMLAARQLRLTRPSPIRHGASFFWVEGLLNIEKLTRLSSPEARLNCQRRQLGHFPVCLATNHFVGEGFWFWVIPLHAKTSLGLVYDRERLNENDVNTPSKLAKWICREFPLFEQGLKNRRIVDCGSYRDFSYDCRQTIDDQKWALTGEAGRFSDPLYSPGGDLISLHNTLITDCIQTGDSRHRKIKSRLYEVLMQAFYQAYVPSYAVSYDLLGDQECFSMKYTWELAVYFTFFVFPFINDLFTNVEFLPSYLRELSKLGKLNHDLQTFLVAYYRWKKPKKAPASKPRFFDFTELCPLQRAEQLFYKVGVSPQEALRVLGDGMKNLEELARFIVAYISAIVAQDFSLLTNSAFVGQLDLERLNFETRPMGRVQRSDNAGPSYPWTFDPFCLVQLHDVIPDRQDLMPHSELASSVADQTGPSAGCRFHNA